MPQSSASETLERIRQRRGAQPPAPSEPPSVLTDLEDFASRQKATITSTTGGRHNPGSAHYDQRAMDLRTRDKSPQEVEETINEAVRLGFNVRDERTKPPGQRVWSGPHLHVEADANESAASQALRRVRSGKVAPRRPAQPQVFDKETWKKNPFNQPLAETIATDASKRDALTNVQLSPGAVAERTRTQRAVQQERQAQSQRGILGNLAANAATRVLDKMPNLSPAAREDINARKIAAGISEPPPTGAQHYLNAVAQSAAEGLAQLPEGAGRIGDLLSKVGRAGTPGTPGQVGYQTPDRLAPNQTPSLAEQLKPAADFGSAVAKTAFPVDESRRGEFGTKLAAGAGSTVPFLAASVASGGSALAPALAGAAQNAQQIGREIEQAGKPVSENDLSVAFAGVTGLTEAVGLGGLMGRFGVKRQVMQKIAEVAKEGGQEGLQQWLNNLNAQVVGAYDPNRPLEQGVAESALIGAILGGVGETASTGGERLAERQTKLNEQAARLSPDYRQKAPAALSNIADATAQMRQQQQGLTDLAQPQQPATAPQPAVRNPQQPAPPMERGDVASAAALLRGGGTPAPAPTATRPARETQNRQREMARNAAIDETLKYAENRLALTDQGEWAGAAEAARNEAAELARFAGTLTDVAQRQQVQRHAQEVAAQARDLEGLATMRERGQRMNEQERQRQERETQLRMQRRQASLDKANQLLANEQRRYQSELAKRQQAEQQAGQTGPLQMPSRLEQLRMEREARRSETATSAENTALDAGERRAEAERRGDLRTVVAEWDAEVSALRDRQKVAQSSEEKAQVARALRNALTERASVNERLKVQLRDEARRANAPTAGLPGERSVRPQRPQQPQRSERLLSAVENEGGGVPKVPTAPVNFGRLAEHAAARDFTPEEREGNASLESFIVRNGGVRPSDSNRGDLLYGRGREGGRPGFISNEGTPVDEMRRQANEAGFGPYETEADFLEALRDARNVFSMRRRMTDRLESEEDEYYRQLVEQEGTAKFGQAEDQPAAATEPVTVEEAAQQPVLYRGSSGESALDVDYGTHPGVWLTSNQEAAGQFGEVNAYRLQPGVKIGSLMDLAQARRRAVEAGLEAGTREFNAAVREDLQRQGIAVINDDGFKGAGGKGREAYNVFDAAALEPVKTTSRQEVPQQPALKDQINSLLDDRNALTRGMDYVRSLYEGRSDDDLVNTLRWARQESNPPDIKRFVASDIAGELRARGVPVDEIKWQIENLTQSPEQGDQQQSSSPTSPRWQRTRVGNSEPLSGTGTTGRFRPETGALANEVEAPSAIRRTEAEGQLPRTPTGELGQAPENLAPISFEERKAFFAGMKPRELEAALQSLEEQRNDNIRRAHLSNDAQKELERDLQAANTRRRELVRQGALPARDQSRGGSAPKRVLTRAELDRFNEALERRDNPRRGLNTEDLSRFDSKIAATAQLRPSPSAQPSQPQPSEPRAVTHDDPAINGKPVLAETADGRVVVPNPENKGGVSVVKDQKPKPKAPIKQAQGGLFDGPVAKPAQKPSPQAIPSKPVTGTVAEPLQNIPNNIPANVRADADTLLRVLSENGGEMPRAKLVREAMLVNSRSVPALELLKKEGRIVEEGGVLRLANQQPAEQAESQPEKPKDAKPERTPAIDLSAEIASRLMSQEAFSGNKNRGLRALAKEITDRYGVATLTDREIYEAMEAGVNRYIAQSKFDLDVDADGLDAQMARVHARVTTLLPTQTVRDARQVSFQQFSTPPDEAMLVGWVANIQKGEEVLEPSAGTGSIAVWGKVAGAKVTANEIDSKRRELLRAQGFKVTEADANYIHYPQILPEGYQPTVVVMNPPFSREGAKGGARNLDVGGNHILAALDRLATGGRLVAIVGEGMRTDAPRYREFFKQVASRGASLRANIGIDGKVYQPYGTNFGTRVLVFDKTPNLATMPDAEAETLAQAAQLLQGVHDDRRLSTAASSATAQATTRPERESNPAQPTRRADTEQSGRKADNGDAVAKPARVGSPESKPATPATSDRQPTGNLKPTGGLGTQPGSTVPGVPMADTRADAGRGDSDRGGSEAARPGRESADRPKRDTPKAAGPVSELRRRSTGQLAELQGQQPTEAEPEEELPAASAFRANKSVAKIEGAKPHPAPLIESAALASVELPPTDYIPDLPQALIDSGRLSEAQLESIVYAGAAHQQTLKNGARRGFFIGDGCVAASTRIFNPITGEHVAIEELLRRGQPHMVLSLTSEGLRPHVATVPFLKGVATLYRVVLDDGRQVAVTGQHRFFTPQGWRKLDDGLGVGDWLACAENGPSSGRADDRNDHPENGESWKGTPEDCLACYSTCRRLYGEQPRLAVIDGLKPFPSQDDVRAHSHPGCDMDDLATLSTRSHHRLSSDRLSKPDFSPRENRDHALSASQDGAFSSQWSAASRPLPAQFQPSKDFLRQVVAATSPRLPGTREAGYFDLSPHSLAGVGRLASVVPPLRDNECFDAGLQAGLNQNRPDMLQRSAGEDACQVGSNAYSFFYYSGWNRIRKVEFIDESEFYDMYVPGAENYVAEGIVHHNTGLGKGATIAGIILDNWRQGRKRAVWITKNNDLFAPTQRDLDWVGLNSKQYLKKQNDTKAGDTIKMREGVLFTTFGTLQSAERTGEAAKAKTRVQQLIDWLGKDFDGVIAIDEAHHLQNELAQKGKRGSKEASKTALAGRALREALPKARIVYLSATGATEPENLAYLDRLGLWGQGTPFADAAEFVGAIKTAGLSAMELVAQNLKQMGSYVSRSISFEGVTQNTLVHDLTEDQRATYDGLSRAWQTIFRNINGALEETEGDAQAKSAAMSQFWGQQQRFFNQMLVTMQMPSVVKAIRKDMAEGKSVVLQVVSTFEAQLNETLAAQNIIPTQREQVIDEIDLTPREGLKAWLKKAFPVTQYETVTTADGNKVKQVAKAPDGSPLENPAAVRMRDKMIAGLDDLRMPPDPILFLYKEFGVDNVAEITGRSVMVYENKENDLVVKRRPDSARKQDVVEFQDGRKRLLIFSRAGGTGASYHADKKAANQQKRVHYLVEAGWQAAEAVQGLGRTHRSNQAQPPHYVLVSTDVKGQKRFISTIARRLEQLGALTRGQRQAGNQSLFSAMDNLEGPYARTALRKVLDDIRANRIEGMSKQDFTEQTGLALEDKEGKPIDIEVPQFLNRLLSMELDKQNAIFDRFENAMLTLITRAQELGTFDQGLEQIKGDNPRIVQEKEVWRDPATGYTVNYVEVAVDRVIDRDSFEVVQLRKPERWLRNRKSGVVWAQFKPHDAMNSEGEISRKVLLQSAGGKQAVVDKEFRLPDYDVLATDTAKKLYNEQLEALPQSKEFKHSLLTGALLPVWDRLPKANLKAKRAVIGQRRILGMELQAKDVEPTLKNFGAAQAEQSAGDLSKMDAAQMFERVLKGAKIKLGNGITLAKREQYGQSYVEFKDWTNARILLNAGAREVMMGAQRRLYAPDAATLAKVLDALGNPAVADVQGKTGTDGVEYRLLGFDGPAALKWLKKEWGFTRDAVKDTAAEFFRIRKDEGAGNALKFAGAEVLNTARAVQLSLDIPILRQGGMLNFNITRKDFWQGQSLRRLADARQAWSDVTFSQAKQALENLEMPVLGKPVRVAQLAHLSGVDFTSDLFNKQADRKSVEEGFESRIGRNLPVIRNLEQFNAVYMDLRRMDVFRRYLDNALRGRELSDEQTQKVLADAAQMVNLLSGRADVQRNADKSERFTPTNLLLKTRPLWMSAQYLSSRLRLLNPGTYARLEPKVRQAALRDVAGFAAFAYGAAALAALGLGAAVSLDPDDSDFMKIKIGDTRYDFIAGFGPVVRLFWQLGKAGATTVKDDVGGQTAAEVRRDTRKETERFLHSKLGALPSLGVTWWNDWTEITGEKVTPGDAVLSRVTPLLLQDVKKAIETEDKTALVKLAPALIGAGVQQYPNPRNRSRLMLQDGLPQRREPTVYDKTFGVRPQRGEAKPAFESRRARFEALARPTAEALQSSPQFQNADAATRSSLQRSLNAQLSRAGKEEEPLKPGKLQPDAIFNSVRQNQREEERKKLRRGLQPRQ